MDDDVPDGGPVGVGHRALGKDGRPIADRELLQSFSALDRRGESAADLSNNCGQIPLADPREVRHIDATSGPLLEPPAVHLKVAPRPVGPDRLEHALRLGRRLLDRGGEPHEPLGVVGGAIAGLGEDPRGDRPGHLGPCLVGHGRLLDAREGLGSELGLSLIQGPFDPFPGLGPRAGRHLIGTKFVTRHGQSSGDGEATRDGDESNRTWEHIRRSHRENPSQVWFFDPRSLRPCRKTVAETPTEGALLRQKTSAKLKDVG